jgi:hypothetical protein
MANITAKKEMVQMLHLLPIQILRSMKQIMKRLPDAQGRWDWPPGGVCADPFRSDISASREQPVSHLARPEPALLSAIRSFGECLATVEEEKESRGDFS